MLQLSVFKALRGALSCCWGTHGSLRPDSHHLNLYPDHQSCQYHQDDILKVPIEGILGTNKQTQTDFCGLRAMLRPSQVGSEVENVHYKQYCVECSLRPPLLSKNVIKIQRQMNWALLFFCSVRADIFAGKGGWGIALLSKRKGKALHYRSKPPIRGLKWI